MVDQDQISIDTKLDGTPQTLCVKRRVYTQIEFDEVYRDENIPKTVKDYCKSACTCSGKQVLTGLLNKFPFIGAIRNYKLRSYIIGDILGGLSAAFLHLPQGLGFGILSSLTPIYGLYTTFFPIVFYVLFGSSPHISFGTNAVIALLTANIVNREEELFLAAAPNGTATEEELLNYKVGAAMAATFISGMILTVMGLLRFGFLTSFLSVSFVGGFTTASAVHISTSQVSKMLHIKIKAISGAGKLIKTYVAIFTDITNTNVADLIIALISMAVLLAVKIGINERFAKKLKIPIPIELIVVILGTIISYYANLNDTFGIAIVGEVPAGLPVPTIPRFDAVPRLASEAFVIAIIIFAMSISMAKLMARQHDYELDDNQELLAYGLTNVGSSFFRCFPSCTAPPRTMILSSLGAKTVLNGISSAIFILIVLLAVGHLFVHLPIAVLAAMIVVAMKNLLLQVTQVPGLWRTSKADFVIWVATFLVGVLADLDLGIIVGVGISILTVIVHTQLTTATSTLISAKEDLFLSGRRQGTKEIPRIKVFSFNSMLYFANAEKFKKEMYRIVFHPATKDKIVKEIDLKGGTAADHQESNLKISVISEKSKDIGHIIIDCSAMSFIDLAGVNVLKLVVTKYSNVGTSIYLSSCGEYMWKTLEKTGFFDNFPKENVFLDVWDAVKEVEKRIHDVGLTTV